MQQPTTALIITTKLYPMPIRNNLVHRRRLTMLLDQGLSCPFTLISAPPGFGKTTLIGEWQLGRRDQNASAQREHALAWLSLDAGDNEPLRFLSHMVAAFRAAQPGIGEATASLLQSSMPPAPSVVIASLINELNAPAWPMVLVLDDYHMIESRVIHEAVMLMIERLPSHAHIIMTTRADPPFPLSRWRARGLMVEVRQDDLRFSTHEVAALLHQTTQLAFSAHEIAALASRTEGWVAALQLAVLASRGQTDSAQFVEAFTGEHRYLMDYLTDEVLAQQPAPVQDFLLATSVLDRMCAELCATVAGDEHSGSPSDAYQALLEQLERANLFIIPLDNERRWYRYHHLFAEVLRGRLRRASLHRINALHRRASTWFAAHGYFDEAIHHAFACKEFTTAAILIENYGETLFLRGSTETLRKLIAALPDEVRDSRPRLLTYKAFFLAMSQRFDEAEACLTTAEGNDAYRLADEAVRNMLDGETDVVRTLILLGQSRFHETIAMGRRALERLPASATRQRGTALQRMGSASWWLGDIPNSILFYRQARQLAVEDNNHATLLRCDYNLAGLETTPQNTRMGRERYKAVIAYAEKHGMGETATAGFAIRDLAEIEYDLNDIATASRCAQRAIDIAAQDDTPNLEALSHCVHARCLWVMGRLDEAWSAVNRAIELTLRFKMAVRYTSFVHACRLRLWLRANKVNDAVAWVEANPLDLNAYIPVRGDEYRAYARVKLAQQQYPEAQEIITRVAGNALRTGMDSALFPALLVKIVLHHEAGEVDAAHAALERALKLGEPDRLIRAFVDEGETMRNAIRSWRLAAGSSAERAPLLNYTQSLLAAFNPQEQASEPITQHAPRSDFFSERELEVLQLIHAGHSNQDIANALFIALGTVKKHLFNIYSKLGVKSRTQAIAKAREMGLV